MKYPLLTLVENAPPGFVFRQRLSHKDVRSTAFALFADSVESAEEQLRQYAGRIAGIIVTYAEAFVWEVRAPLLFHFGVPLALRPHLQELLTGILGNIEMLQAGEDTIRQRSIDLMRCIEDRKMVEHDFARSRESLLEEISERRRSEESLRESEDRFRTIFDSVNDAIFIFHQKTGTILYVNKRMCELFGYTRDEALGLDLGVISSGEPLYTQKEALQWMKKAIKAGPQLFEWQCKNKTGKLFWVEVNMRSSIIGKQECIVLTVRDITERKQGEMERERLARELQSALAAKVKQLSGFLPICASCKKIRDDKGYWNQIESYIRDHSEAEFSHGLCPDCAKRMYSDFMKKE